jgi:hypothetical protein
MIKEIMCPSPTKLNSWVCGFCVQPLPGYCRTVIRGMEQGPKVPVYMDKAFSRVQKKCETRGRGCFFHENENLKEMEVSLKEMISLILPLELICIGICSVNSQQFTMSTILKLMQIPV